MFPVNDFNFVVAGIATFAATVGYACTRRLSSSLSGPDIDILGQTVGTGQAIVRATTPELPLSDEPQGHTTLDANANSSQMPVIPNNDVLSSSSTLVPVRRVSLKRKIPHDGFDEPKKEDLGYPHNLANIYPNKRSRTPSSESETTTPTPIVTSTPSLDSIISRTSDEDVEIPMVSNEPQTVVPSPAPEPPRTPSPAPEEPSPRAPSPVYQAQGPLLISPAPISIATAAPQPTTPQPTTPKLKDSTSFTTPRPVTPKPFATPSGGFAAFAGSSSPFASLSKPKQSSSKARPIWSSGPGDLGTQLNEGEQSSEALVADVFNPLSKSKSKARSLVDHAIDEAKATFLHSKEKYTHITGEEGEDVELEQKGVKLYTKRGDKPFSDGVGGHIKLLANKTTLEERILFRREPLWKVSMNVRVKPSVRCTYAAEENVLRVILNENVVEKPVLGSAPTPTEAGEVKQEVVIYALRPGRSCSKQDFREFAESLMKSPHFKTSTASTVDPSP